MGPKHKKGAPAQGALSLSKKAGYAPLVDKPPPV